MTSIVVPGSQSTGMALGTARISKQFVVGNRPIYQALSHLFFAPHFPLVGACTLEQRSQIFFFPLQDLKETSLAGPVGQNVFFKTLKNLVTKIFVRFALAESGCSFDRTLSHLPISNCTTWIRNY